MVETESFIKEVSEEVKRDNLFKILNKFKWPLFALIILLIGAVGGYEYFKFSKKARAQKNGEFLVSAIENLKNNKALCVNLIRNIDSFYLENKKIQNQKEVVLIIKTCCTSIQIQRSLKKIHRYDTPIIVELKTGLPNKDYLKWFFAN